MRLPTGNNSSISRAPTQDEALRQLSRQRNRSHPQMNAVAAEVVPSSMMPSPPPPSTASQQHRSSSSSSRKPPQSPDTDAAISLASSIQLKEPPYSVSKTNQNTNHRSLRMLYAPRTAHNKQGTLEELSCTTSATESVVSNEEDEYDNELQPRWHNSNTAVVDAVVANEEKDRWSNTRQGHMNEDVANESTTSSSSSSSSQRPEPAAAAPLLKRRSSLKIKTLQESLEAASLQDDNDDDICSSNSAGTNALSLQTNNTNTDSSMEEKAVRFQRVTVYHHHAAGTPPSPYTVAALGPLKASQQMGLLKYEKQRTPNRQWKPRSLSTSSLSTCSSLSSSSSSTRSLPPSMPSRHNRSVHASTRRTTGTRKRCSLIKKTR